MDAKDARVATNSFPPLNLYIGTGGDILGAASLPLGALRLVSDTSDREDPPAILNRYAGYYYSDTYNNIFSHTHVFSAGIVDYGEISDYPVQVDGEDNIQQMIANKQG
ncbi:unnamed protein product, partial [Rotaria sp. Silwood2]